MTWKTLAESLESALASMMIDGDGAVGAAPDAGKDAGAEAPASWCQGGTALPVQEVHTDKERRIAPASPKAGMGRPSPAVRRSLFVVVEGGGRPATGGVGRAAYAQARGGSPASNLSLVR